MSLMVDYITMPPKSQEVSQIQTVEQTRMQQGNQEMTAQFQTQVEQQSHMTVRRNRAENQELRDEEKRKKQNTKKKGSGQKKSNKNEADKKNTMQDSGHFDIRI